MQIVPALYLKDGKVAVYRTGRLDNMEFLPYDPYQLIEILDKLEFRSIYLVDVDASLGKGDSNHGLIGSLANTAIANIIVGGGLNSIEYIKSLQYAGVNYFVIGTAAIENPNFIKEISEDDSIPNDRVCIAVDIVNGKLTSHGFSEIEKLSLDEFIDRSMQHDFNKFLIADIEEEKSGDQQPEFDLFRRIVKRFPDARIAATGWIHDEDHVEALREIGVWAVVVGNEIYKDKSLLSAVRQYNRNHEVEGRYFFGD